MYKTLGFKWLFGTFCPAPAFLTADSDEARNPQRFIHVTVAHNYNKNKITKNRNYGITKQTESISRKNRSNER